jgi:hypothetical protein
MNRLKGGGVMDRNELINEIAGSSAEGFAAFQRDLLARRTEVMRGRLKTLSTSELRSRATTLFEDLQGRKEATKAIVGRQLEDIDWIHNLGNGAADADVEFTAELARDADWNVNINFANQAEARAIFDLLIHRG